MKNILIIAGPSAVGKTTVVKELISIDGSFELIRSATTRLPRGDGNDSEYLYLNRSDFISCVQNGSMLESTEYDGNFYGTPRFEIERVFDKGKIPVLILDINGVRTLKERCLDFGVVSVYLWDDVKILKNRLEDRYLGTLSGENKLNSRLLQNARDYKSIKENKEYFDAFIKNDKSYETATMVRKEFLRISSGEKRDTEYVDYVANLLEALQ